MKVPHSTSTTRADLWAHNVSEYVKHISLEPAMFFKKSSLNIRKSHCIIPGDTLKCRNGSKIWSGSHVCGVSQLQCDRSSCRPYSHKHSEAAFINTPLLPKITENGARALEPSSCCWNFSGLICINKEAVPCRNVFYPAQKIPGRSPSVEHWENPTVRADKTNESWCQRRVAPRWQIEKNCPSVDRHASFSN